MNLSEIETSMQVSMTRRGLCTKASDGREQVGGLKENVGNTWSQGGVVLSVNRNETLEER